MTKGTKPIPDGYGTVTPYLVARRAADAIASYVPAGGATGLLRMPRPDRRIGHAELRAGTSRVMLADAVGAGAKHVEALTPEEMKERDAAQKQR